jgi:hypothetical protein
VVGESSPAKNIEVTAAASPFDQAVVGEAGVKPVGAEKAPAMPPR